MTPPGLLLSRLEMTDRNYSTTRPGPTSQPPVRARPGRPRRGATCRRHPPGPGVPCQGRAPRRRGPLTRAARADDSGGGTPGAYHSRPPREGAAPTGLTWRRTRCWGIRLRHHPPPHTKATWPPPLPRRTTLLGGGRTKGPRGRGIEEGTAHSRRAGGTRPRDRTHLGPGEP